MDHTDDATPTPHIIYENNVANDQARVHYGDVYGDVYHGDVYHSNKSFEDTLLESLCFPGMNGQYERPLEAFSGTYEWICHGEDAIHDCDACHGLTERRLDVQTRDDWLNGHRYARCRSARLRDSHRSYLRMWLQERASNDMIWVHGKPGSGKSTLMRYIFEELGRVNTDVQAEGMRQVVAGHFFWAAGGPLQKSLVGLLQNLLYQICKDARQLIPQLFSTYQTSHRDLHAKTWTYCELFDALEIALRAGPTATQYVFLIDGLDEAGGDKQDLVDLLIQLASWDSIKLIVASRPYNAFQNAFGRSQHRPICLQDVNDADIDLYIQSRLDSTGNIAWRSIAKSEIAQISGLLRDRAEGVFFWVKLAVDDVRDGFADGDNITDLTKRVKRMPKRLEDFIQDIFKSVDEIYKVYSARLMLCCHARSHMGFYPGLPLIFARSLMEEVDDPDFALHAPVQQMTRREYEEIIKEAHASVMKWTKGLMVVEDRVSICCIGSCANLASHLSYSKIDFAHRSVYDFVQQRVDDGTLATKAGAGYSWSLSACRIQLRIFAYSEPTPACCGFCAFHMATFRIGEYAGCLDKTNVPLQTLRSLFTRLDFLGRELCPDQHWVFPCGFLGNSSSRTKDVASQCMHRNDDSMAWYPKRNFDVSLIPPNSICGLLTFLLLCGCDRTFFTMRHLVSGHELRTAVNIWLLIAVGEHPFRIDERVYDTELLSKLFILGADPNAAIPQPAELKYSVWQRKLLALHCHSLGRHSHGNIIDMDAWVERDIGLVKEMILHGADPDAKVLVDETCVHNQERAFDEWPVKGLVPVAELFGPPIQQILVDWMAPRCVPEYRRYALALFRGIYDTITRASEEKARKNQITSRKRGLHISRWLKPKAKSP